MNNKIKEHLREVSGNYLNKNIIPTKLELTREIENELETEEKEILNSIVLEWYENVFLLKYINFEIDNIEEIVVQNNESIIYYTNSQRLVEDIIIEKEDYELSLEILCIRFEQNWNYVTPFVSFYLKWHNQQWRASLVHHSMGPKKVCKFFLRKIHENVINVPLANHLQKIISAKKNILICGATGSGKTTLLKKILQLTDKNEHIVIIEDTHELNLSGANFTYLLSNEKNLTMNDLLSHSMRIRPDRIVIGELRSLEVTPFLLAMNSGHNGSLSTIHAGCPVEAIHRLSLLIQIYAKEINVTKNQSLEIVCQAIDYVVFMKNKKIKEVIRLTGAQNGNIFYENIDEEKSTEENTVELIHN